MAPESAHEQALRESNDNSSSSEDLNDPAVDGWEDLEDDTVTDTFISLFDSEKFEDVSEMFKYCKAKYDFDIWQIQRQHDLDFIGLVKLVNYVRSSVANGTTKPELSPKGLFEDDRYLMPALESDAVLYNLEDILTQSRTFAQTQVEELREQMEALQARFDAYKHDVSKYLDDKLINSTPDAIINGNPTTIETKTAKQDRFDQDYFQSYSFNAIHETMLKDKIRTDAYRDFIYDNKDIFKDKTVLDVGCGTGILSMFCAKAGAKQVIAVDNSDIIHATKEIIRANRLDDRILCLKGKIEEVELPVTQVDIIVSEWMGYCLLYESMLDSVIRARDKYLAPGGLMVPSHATMEVGILSDSDLRDSHIDFWNDVYGFDMRSMVNRASEECLIRSVEDVELSGTGTTFRTLDLHTITVADLDFKSGFSLQTRPTSMKLDGFVLWFDMFFQRSQNATIDGLTTENAKSKGITSFSTGPFTQQTHWQQGVCFTDPSATTLEGRNVIGHVTFQKAAKDMRGLKIEIEWQLEDSSAQTQSWQLA